MSKKNIIAHTAAIVVCIILGLWVSHCARKPVETVKVERDTVVVYDTITDVAPKAKDSVVTKWVTRYLPTRPDTIHHYAEVGKMIHDTMAVEVPITSKHYNSPEYDAWVSGYEPSLDSIKVYREAQYITERVTISKPPNKWELDAVAGLDYNVATQRYTPHIGGELMYKPSRLQVGIRGGVIKNDNFEPFTGAVIKYRLF
jgi:hypothetical protein